MACAEPTTSAAQGPTFSLRRAFSGAPRLPQIQAPSPIGTKRRSDLRQRSLLHRRVGMARAERLASSTRSTMRLGAAVRRGRAGGVSDVEATSATSRRHCEARAAAATRYLRRAAVVRFGPARRRRRRLPWGLRGRAPGVPEQRLGVVAITVFILKHEAPWREKTGPPTPRLGARRGARPTAPGLTQRACPERAGSGRALRLSQIGNVSQIDPRTP